MPPGSSLPPIPTPFLTKSQTFSSHITIGSEPLVTRFLSVEWPRLGCSVGRAQAVWRWNTDHPCSSSGAVALTGFQCDLQWIRSLSWRPSSLRLSRATLALILAGELMKPELLLSTSYSLCTTSSPYTTPIKRESLWEGLCTHSPGKAWDLWFKEQWSASLPSSQIPQRQNSPSCKYLFCDFVAPLYTQALNVIEFWVLMLK